MGSAEIGAKVLPFTFEHVSRYITGLLLSPNKTLQGIHGQQVWPETADVSRRAMHAGVFEAGWDSEGLLPAVARWWPRRIGAGAWKSLVWIGTMRTMSRAYRRRIGLFINNRAAADEHFAGLAMN